MWAKQKQASGFTIVELLIVIVIIGILAAITIVAYNGIQERARISSVTSALSQADKKLVTYQVDNPDTYPINKAALEALGIKDGSSVSYQYTRTAGPPDSYCLTATAGPTSYKISSTTKTPATGGCAGHGVGGVDAITNLATNPTFQGDTAGWSTGGYGSGGVGSTSRVAGISPTGGAAMRSTWTTAATSAGHQSATQFLSIESGKTYTMSVWLRASSITNYGNVRVQIGAAIVQSPNVTLPANTWTRVSHTFTATSTGTNGIFAGRIDSLAGTPNGFTFDVANFMLTEGPTLHAYADGNSPNWTWNGSQNNSTSTGPV